MDVLYIIWTQPIWRPPFIPMKEMKYVSGFRKHYKKLFFIKVTHGCFNDFFVKYNNTQQINKVAYRPWILQLKGHLAFSSQWGNVTLHHVMWHVVWGFYWQLKANTKFMLPAFLSRAACQASLCPRTIDLFSYLQPCTFVFVCENANVVVGLNMKQTSPCQLKVCTKSV